jgi:flagellar hook-associated protein FlgK
MAGMSLDKAMGGLIRFRQIFQAFTRVLTTIGSMLELVINQLGPTGR